MKTISSLERTALLSIFLLMASAAIAQDAYKVRDDITSCVWVRNGHSTDASKIQCLAAGTPVSVISSIPFWREVRFGNNQPGWIAKKYIEPVTVNVIQPASAVIPDNAMLTIHFVDVGQGDAIWIQTHDDGIDGNGIFEGYNIVIDGGPYSADASNPLLPYMEDEGHHGADVEALIVTHPHDDHYSGAETVVRHFSINHYYDPGYPENNSTPSFLTFRNAAKAKASHSHIGKQNFGTLNWGSELKVEVLYAWEGDASNELGSGNTEQNNASIVLRIQYGDHVFLLMGDAEGKDRADSPQSARYVEKILLQQPDRLKATLLKIAHHGSETSSSVPFIQSVNPDIVIVQSGRKSFNGTFIPDTSTLQRYCANNPNVKIYRTDEGDAGKTAKAAVDKDNIIIKTNGKGKPQVIAYRDGQPFAGTSCSN